MFNCVERAKFIYKMTQLEVGAILEGQVTKIAAFGAFVALGGRQSGMVHISELSYAYIKDIQEVVHVGDTLRVKVIAIDERGRISLSVKQAMSEAERTAQALKKEAQHKDACGNTGDFACQSNRVQPKTNSMEAPSEYTPYVRSAAGRSVKNNGSRGMEYAGSDGFEEMMNRFKTISDEKISDLRKYTDGRRYTKRRK